MGPLSRRVLISVLLTGKRSMICLFPSMEALNTLKEAGSSIQVTGAWMSIGMEYMCCVMVNLQRLPMVIMGLRTIQMFSLMKTGYQFMYIAGMK